MQIGNSSAKKWSIVLATVLAITIGHAPAWADNFTLTFSGANAFSGAGSTGSLTANFFDVNNGTCGGVANQTGVCLVITSNLATNSGIQENVDPGKGFYFNLTEAESTSASILSGLAFTEEAFTGGFSTAATLSTGDDAFKADGLTGQFEVNLTWGPSIKAFTNGESQTYLITDSGGTIAADDFLSLSDIDGSPLGGCNPTDMGSCIAAVHIQNTGSNGQDSGWEAGTLAVATPEPNAIAMTLFGCGLIYLFRRKHGQRA